MRGRMPRHDDLLERLMAKVRTKKQSSAKETGANLGFEAKLWQAADALRNNMDAAEYKHVVLGLIFLKYISDAFEAKHDELVAQTTQGADPEDPDEYRAASIFWVPKEARWAHLKARAPQPEIGQIVDNAMAAIEQDNPSLKVSCRRITHGQVWTSNGLASSSISSAISDWAAPPIAPRIFSAVSTNTSSPNSQAPKARRADSSIRRPAWSVCWSKCSLHTWDGFTILAAVPAGCLCRARSSSKRTAAGSATFPFTVRSRSEERRVGNEFGQ